jgi:hypothetical protein
MLLRMQGTLLNLNLRRHPSNKIQSMNIFLGDKSKMVKVALII